MPYIIVHSTTTGQRSHAQICAEIASATAIAAVRTTWVICRTCCYERPIGQPCGLPCV